MKEKEEAKKEEVEVDESNELQAIMALDDVGIEAEINKKGEVTVKKKDLKKAEAALKKSFTRGGQPKLVGEDIELTNEESKLQKEYKAFYAKMLEKFGVKSPGELDDDKKKEFYDAIEKGWKEGEGPVKEEVKVDEASLGSMLDKKAKKLGKKKKKVDEDAPANSVSGGNVDLSPHKKKKRINAKVEYEDFGGTRVYVVPSERWHASRLGKNRYSRYEKYIGNDKLGETIRLYGRENPKSPIILKNEANGAMLYLKYGGSKRQW
jgi:hypothetical protein